MGSDPIKALLSLISQGNALIKTVPYNCGFVISNEAKSEAINYKISDGSVLFGPEEYKKPASSYLPAAILISQSPSPLINTLPLQICR